MLCLVLARQTSLSQEKEGGVWRTILNGLLSVRGILIKYNNYVSPYLVMFRGHVVAGCCGCDLYH